MDDYGYPSGNQKRETMWSRMDKHQDYLRLVNFAN